MATDVSQPWVEKYRPKKIDDVAHQEEVISTLTSALETANMPHLLFYGPPGTGKTTTALAIGRQLYGSASAELPKLFSARVMELNASDERGISVVRNKIKTFASSSIGKPDPDFPCPPYKLLILDEADAMTQDAQNALRRIMETHSNVTRFCFICNYVSRIIEPLASRCAKFRFKPLHEGIMEERITSICKSEDIQLGPGAMDLLGRVSHGDLRRAITTLQSAASLAGSPVKMETLIDVSGEVPSELVDGLIAACRKPALAAAQAQVAHVFAEGFSTNAVLEQLLMKLMELDDLSDLKKARVVGVMAAADKRLVDGADGVLQMQHVLSVLQQVYQGA